MTTNLERIRQMNSEELAEFLCKIALCNHCGVIHECEYGKVFNCKKEMQVFLEQEVEE